MLDLISATVYWVGELVLLQTRIVHLKLYNNPVHIQLIQLYAYLLQRINSATALRFSLTAPG